MQIHTRRATHTCPPSERRIEDPHAPTKRIAKNSTLRTPKRADQHPCQAEAQPRPPKPPANSQEPRSTTKNAISKNSTRSVGLPSRSEDLDHEEQQRSHETSRPGATGATGRVGGARETPPCQSGKAPPAFDATCINQRSTGHHHLKNELNAAPETERRMAEAREETSDWLQPGTT